jgi:hypothetical protein
MNEAKKWINDILSTPEGARTYERERVLIDATEAVSELMERMGVSRKDLATTLEVTPANVTQILSGTRNLTLGTLSDVFVVLGRSLRIEHEPLRPEVRLHGPIPMSCGWPSSTAWSTSPQPTKTPSDGELAA